MAISSGEALVRAAPILSHFEPMSSNSFPSSFALPKHPRLVHLPVNAQVQTLYSMTLPQVGDSSRFGLSGGPPPYTHTSDCELPVYDHTHGEQVAPVPETLAKYLFQYGFCAIFNFLCSSTSTNVVCSIFPTVDLGILHPDVTPLLDCHPSVLVLGKGGY